MIPGQQAVVAAAQAWKAKRDLLRYPRPSPAPGLDGRSSIPEAAALYAAVEALGDNSPISAADSAWKEGFDVGWRAHECLIEAQRAAPPHSEALGGVNEPDIVDDGVEVWLVGDGLDVTRDATSALRDPTYRVGSHVVSAARMHMLRDSLTAALTHSAKENRG